MNSLTDLELYSHHSKTIDIVIEKLKSIRNNPKSKEMKYVKSLAIVLSRRDLVREKSVNPLNEVKGVHFSYPKNTWIAQASVKGKKVHIKSNKDKQIVIDALRDFRIRQSA